LDTSIVDLAQDPATALYTVSLANPLTPTSGTAITNVVIGAPTALPTLTLSVQQAEIGLLTTTGTMPKKIQYLTTSCEEVTSDGAGRRYQRLFQCEPEAQGFLVCFPVTDSVQSVILNSFLTYRLAVNGDGIQRSVSNATSLFWDR
jgi:hypothetical protein